MKLVRLAALPDEGVSHETSIRKRVMLGAGDVANVMQFAQARFTPGQVAGAHAHRDMSEVFFVSAGEGTIVVDGQSHRLTPGTCIAIQPGEQHEIRNDGSAELVLTYFGVLARPVTTGATV